METTWEFHLWLDIYTHLRRIYFFRPPTQSAKIPTHNGPQPQPTLSMSRFFRFRLKVCQWALPNVRTEKKKKNPQIMRMFFPSICWEFVCLQWLQLTQLTNGYGNVPSFGNSATHVEFIGILRRASPPRRVKKFTRQVGVKNVDNQNFSVTFWMVVSKLVENIPYLQSFWFPGCQVENILVFLVAGTG